MRDLESHATHTVFNQPPPLLDYNPFTLDLPLHEATTRYVADEDTLGRLAAFGARVGSGEVADWGVAANRHPPELSTHDRFGNRLDQVTYHPAYHELMRLGLAEAVHSLPWSDPAPGNHVLRAARHYLLTQAEASVLCPITMTFAAVPTLAVDAELAAAWTPRILSTEYDPRLLPVDQKRGATVGMAMTEKQGGSDVRSNTTRAVSVAGSAREHLLTGHKWFCSAPMSDAFLTLAQTGAGLTCFLVPRFRRDGTRNTVTLHRLKDKLGNRANASAEIEYHDTWALRLGADGRGVPTILEMVNHTRLDCAIGSAGLMRQALTQALHHCRHRRAFGRLLIEQPLMRNVLADLALESEAATALALRVARAYETSDGDEVGFRRLVTAVGKYWLCKRCPAMVAEALECLGGGGYVEESILPRLYREAPLSSIWEGSGNVICLDVLRIFHKHPESLTALRAELADARGADRRYGAHLDRLERQLADTDALEHRARRLVENLALALQASLLLRHAPTPVADAFCASRLTSGAGHQYGTLPRDVDLEPILRRAWPGE